MTNTDDVIAFLIDAKKATYAGSGSEELPSRPGSHDFKYAHDGLLYIDTYLGGKNFSGEEAIFRESKAFWAMNYIGRVLSEKFDGDFLKEVLCHVPVDMPFRGPKLYDNGKYVYRCSVDGNFNWYCGHEKIFLANELIYECRFHGGTVE